MLTTTAKATAAAADAVTLTRKEMPARPVSQAVTTLARPMNRREHVSQFLSAVIRPDESSGASLRALHSKYAAWSPSQKPKKRDAPGGSAFYVPGKYSPQPGHRQGGSYELSHTTRRLDALPAGQRTGAGSNGSHVGVHAGSRRVSLMHIAIFPRTAQIGQSRVLLRRWRVNHTELHCMR